MSVNSRNRKMVLGSFRVTVVFLVLPLLFVTLAGEHFSWQDPLRADDLTGQDYLSSTGEEYRRKTIDRIEESLAMRFPGNEYLMVDSRQNVLYLKRDGETLCESIVSCGSGDTLEEPESGRSWVFSTPRGFFRITSKMVNPDWIKPDWAFIEEGRPVPDDPGQRFESGALGDYALGFGNGYFIHGTLYPTLLGKSVSHGCIRMGKEDLEALFETVDIGTPVFIY